MTYGDEVRPGLALLYLVGESWAGMLQQVFGFLSYRTMDRCYQEAKREFQIRDAGRMLDGSLENVRHILSLRPTVPGRRLFLASDATFINIRVDLQLEAGIARGLTPDACAPSIELIREGSAEEKLLGVARWAYQGHKVLNAVHGVLGISADPSQPPIMLGHFPSHTGSVASEFTAFQKEIQRVVLGAGFEAALDVVDGDPANLRAARLLFLDLIGTLHSEDPGVLLDIPPQRLCDRTSLPGAGSARLFHLRSRMSGSTLMYCPATFLI
jgi:hypothetical protein